MNRAARLGAVGAVLAAATGALVITDALAAACTVPVTATAISPTTGFAVGGTTVTITGTNFVTCHIDRVSFGAVDGTSLVRASETTLTVRTPAGSGAATPVLHFDSGAVSPPTAFTYVPVPVLTDLRPPKGPLVGGTEVILTGSALQATGGTSAVTFGTETAVPDGASATRLTVGSPAGASAGPVPVAVVVTLATGESATSNSLPFTYVAAPTVTAVDATSGPSEGGEIVTITGTGFQRGALVLFGRSDGSVEPAPDQPRFGDDRAAPVVERLDSEHLRVVSPSGPPGVVSIVVQNPDEQFGALTDGYTYDGAVPAATTADPATGASLGGEEITITGTGFAVGASVVFGEGADRATAPAVTVVSDTSLVVTTPPHPPSATPVAIEITNPNGAASTLPAAFTYTASPAPTIATIGPPASDSSLGGTSLTIVGTGFAVGARVSFGSPFSIGDREVVPEVAAGVVSSTRLTVGVPAHPAGAVDVVVTNPDGQASDAATFTYTAAPTPTIGSVSPSSGPTTGGTTLTVSGSGFSDGARVLVGGIDLRAVVDGDGSVLPIVRDSSTIVGVVGNHPSGTVDVVVINADGVPVTSAAAFTYTGPPAPALTSISPATGDTLGGLAVELVGANFADGSIVTFGNADCTDSPAGAACNVQAPAGRTTWVNGGLIRTVTPAGVYGFVDVTVVGPDGVATTLPYGFDFGDGAAPPTITSVTPASGPSGTTITIGGTGFAHTGGTTPNSVEDARASVDGDALVDPPEQTSSTRIIGDVPTRPGGTATVTVVNPDRQGAILANGFAYPVDTTAPTTTASATTGQPPVAHAFGAGNWATGPVTVSLVAADDPGGSGVDRIVYSATGAQQISSTTVFGSSTNFVITAQGLTDVTYRARDISGIDESPSTRVVAIDSVPPSITASSTFVAGTQTNADVDVEFSCTDAAGGSGLGGAITVTSADVVTVTGSNPLTVTFTEVGLGQSVTARCVDVAGNVTTKVFGGVNITRFGLDLTASATTADGRPYVAGTWTNQDVVVTFTCRPPAGQIPPGSPQVAMVTRPQHVRTSTTNRDVEGECRDTAGNTVRTSFSGIYVDKTLPVITASATSGGAPYTAGQWTNRPVVVTFTCTDDGADQSGVASSSPPITVDADGTTAGVEGTCRDVAGNSANPPAFLGPILIDQVPPSCSVLVTPNPVGPANGKLTFVSATVSTDDDRSGPAGITLVSVTSSRPSTAASDIVGFVPGTASTTGSVRTTKGNVYTFTYVATDRAGSTSAPCAVQLPVG